MLPGRCSWELSGRKLYRKIHVRLSLKERRMRSANPIKVHRKSGVAEWRDLLFFPPTPILSSVTFSLRHSTSGAAFQEAG